MADFRRLHQQLVYHSLHWDNNLSNWDTIAYLCGIFFVLVGLLVVFSGWIISQFPNLIGIFDALSDQKFIAGLTIFGLGFAYLAYLAAK
jgi:hypothetical protein